MARLRVTGPLSRERVWGGAWCTLLLGTAASVFAQEEPAGAAKLEAIVVTGSNIKRTEIETALPVQIITREEFERSGASTAAELMTHVPANLIGKTDVPFVFNFQAGLSSANLRGLGDASTLVLINGRRLANYAADGGTVNLNFIPVAAIERVEVLKDGASAIYGADAMAGVVNFILREDFAGLQLSAYGSQPQHGGGEQTQVNLTGGYGNPIADRFNAFATVSYQKNNALPARDRPYSSTAFRPDEGITDLNRETFPADIRIDPSTWVNPSYATGCMPPASLPLPGTERCGHNRLAFVNLLPPQERTNVLAGGTWQIGADTRLFGQYLYSYNRYELIRPPALPSAASTAGGRAVLYPAGGPYYPTEFAAAHGINGTLDVYFQTLSLGPVTNQTRIDAQHLVVGTEATIAGWTYNVAWTYSTNGQKYDSLSGNVSTRKLLAAMATGLINPFGPSGPEGDALLANTQVTGNIFHTDGATNSVEIKASGDLLALPAGPVSAAIGGEARREKLTVVFPPEFNSGDVVGSSLIGYEVDGNRSVAAVFGELYIPVTHGIDAQVAARFDDYSDFGSTTNSKLALRWQPLRSLLLRTSYGTGFRPPTLLNLHTPSTVDTDLRLRSDPVRCPITGLPSDCSTHFAVITGGSPDLAPETSRQFNAGIVWEPLGEFSLGADYWRIVKKQTVGVLSADALLGHFDVFEGTKVYRGPVEPTFPQLPGPIALLDLRTQNLGQLRTAGVDVFSTYRSHPTPLGRFGLNFDGTYIGEWEQQLNGVEFVSGAGRDVAGPIPRWRHYLALTWNYGVWGATVAQTYSSGYTDAKLNAASVERRVGSYDIWDAQGSYSGWKNTTLAFGIKNLFDRDPPFSNQSDLGQVMYDPRYADPRGRTFYAQITLAFK